MDTIDKIHLDLINLWSKYCSEKKPDELINIFTDEFIYEDVATGTISHNEKELREFMESVYTKSPDIKFIIKNSFVKDNRGCAEWIMVGTQTGPLKGGIPPTNKKFEIKGTSVFSFEGEKIKGCSDYSDMLTLMNQIGLINKK